MIHPFISYGFESNCFVVTGEKAAVIDTGKPAAVLEKVDELGIPVGYIINTHCHFDHVLGLLQLKEETGALVAAHEEDATAIEAGDSRRILSNLFGSRSQGIKVDVKLKEGDVIDLGGIGLEVIHTPGHTPGGLCLYEPASKSLFSGDTVFADSIGRTDFPGGDSMQMKESLEKLMHLHEERGIETVYPGHGPTGDGDNIEVIYNCFFG